MIQINLKSGTTVHFDLCDQKGGRAGFDKFCQDPTVPQLITGLGILYNGQAFLIPIPKEKNKCIAGIGGGVVIDENENKISSEFVWYKLDDMVIKQTVYTGANKVAKVEIQRMKW